MKKAISLVVLLALSLSLAVGAAADHIVYWSMWESTEAQGQVIQKAIDQFVADTGHTVAVQRPHWPAGGPAAGAGRGHGDRPV